MVFTDFYTAYWWLYNHPMFQEEFEIQGGSFSDKYPEVIGEKVYESHFKECLDVYVAKVNPEIMSIDDDESKNTKVQIWLEAGVWNPDYGNHDIELDCEGDTFEEAIINLANLVMEWYGETKERLKYTDSEIEWQKFNKEIIISKS